MKSAILIFFLLLVFCCQDRVEPFVLFDNIALQELYDNNLEADVVEVNLEARVTEVEYRAGVKTEVYAYNGLIPGPMIRAKVGDTLIVHFTNKLPEPTTIHWHGLELPANMDGSNISQSPIAANGGKFTYQFKLNRASLFWFHPLIRTDVQIEKGLYGVLLVEDSEENISFELPEEQAVLVLDDVLLDEQGQVEAQWPEDPFLFVNRQMNGREGNVLLVNGQEFPIVEVANGTPVRLRLVNVANSRLMRLSFSGMPFYRIGGDSGLISHSELRQPIGQVQDPNNESNFISDPDLKKGILLAPGERADIVLTPKGEDGDLVYLEWHDLKRGRHVAHQEPDGNIGLDSDPEDGRAAHQTMMVIKLKGSLASGEEYAPPESLKPIQNIFTDNETSRLPIVFGHELPDENGQIVFFATMKDGVGVPFADLEPDDGVQATVDQTYILEVTNLTAGMHPFHMHGFHFQLIATQFMDLDYPENNRFVYSSTLENKDTVIIPGRPGFVQGRSKTITRLAVNFDDTGREGKVEAFGKVPTETMSGGWLVHCNTLEHAVSGMMTFINLKEPVDEEKNE